MKNQNKPIAIVGIGCRFPGSSSSPEKFWEMLLNKTDAITDVPSDRWDNRSFYDDDDSRPGKIRAKQGGFLKENIKEFDPMFFGISPIEAESLDPQERMLLEVAYEACEDAGTPIESLKGSDTGVFVGGFTFDNYLLKTSKENQHLINSHTAAGISLTMLSNRLSYFFDLKGPSITIDTACSSSLVATHYACQSIWNGESSQALVGGVNLLLKPEVSVVMGKGQFLSKHSRCKTFDSDAGGYVRGEGAGVLMLKSQEQAIKDGDRIYALINGSGVNQDGNTNGITVPNKSSQLELIRKIYEENNINIDNVDYIEAHGTGTPVGDPIEFGALNETLSGRDSSEPKCLVGSVKSNIGHLEAASGIAGLIKTALCLHNNQVPANLHFNQPNPALNYEQSVLKVPTSLAYLPEGRASYASINSFGYGGTNAHVLLQQYSADNLKKDYTLNKQDHFIFPICARSKNALKELISSFKSHLENYEINFAQFLSNTVYKKSLHSSRLAIVASSKEELLEKIEATEEDIPVKGVVQANAEYKKPKVAFVYTGMGPQWWKMGRELMDKEPVFNQAIQEADTYFKEIAGWSIVEELVKPEAESKVKETNIAQTANFVIQVGLTKLLEYYGISPDAVVGHSVGEVTSSYISGALTLKEALLVSYNRSRLQHTTAGTGSMLAVGLSETDLEGTLNDYKDVSIAAINSKKSVTLAGGQKSLNQLADKFKSQEVFHRMLDVVVPYHSPMMNPIKDELLASLTSLKGKDTTVDLYSTVWADKLKGTEIDNNYWWRNVREPVRFAKTMDALIRDQYNVFVEIGPHPVLKNSMKESVKEGDSVHFIETLNHREPEQLNFFENLASLFTIGLDLNWERWVKKMPHLTLPSHPWQKESYWVESKKSIQNRIGAGGSVFLHEKLDSPQLTFRVELNKHFFPFMNDHVVQDKVVFPGAGYVAAGLAFYQQEISTEVPLRLENVKFHQMLVIDNEKNQNLYTTYNSENNQLGVYSNEVGDDTPWIQRATGRFTAGTYQKKKENIDIKSILSRLETTIPENAIYDKLSGAKLDYGPYFRTIKEIKCNETELIARITGHSAIKDSKDEFFIHPTLLDACFQSMIVFDSSEFVPVSIGKLHCYSTPGDELLCYTRVKGYGYNSVVADLVICDENGNVAIEIEDFKCQELVAKSMDESFPTDCLYETNWTEEKTVTENSLVQEEVLTYVFAKDIKQCTSLVNKIPGSVVLIEDGASFEKLNEAHYIADFQDVNSVAQALNLESTKNVSLVYLLGEVSIKTVSMASEDCLREITPLMNIVQLFSKKTNRKNTLNLITHGSQLVFEEDRLQSIESTVLHGLGRLISNELPSWQVRLIDFENSSSSHVSEEVLELSIQKMYTSTKLFEEIAIRENKIFKKGMQQWEERDPALAMEKIEFQSRPVKLVSSQTGLESVFFENTEYQELKSNEIEISVENTSISTNDYLKITDKISPEVMDGTFTGTSVGSNCAGVVTKVGTAVSKFKVGDKVIAYAKGTLQSFTNTSEELAIKCPQSIKGDDSSSILTNLPAIYALKYKANLQRDEKIIIHNAAMGVGLAATHYALKVGAEVYAIAHNTEGQDYLKSIGVKHVFSQEDLDFSRDILKRTKNEGVNVILSASSQESLYQSLSILAPHGTYLKLGKEVGNSTDLPLMDFFDRNISYVSIDIERMLLDKPEKISELLNELSDLSETESLQPLPTRVFGPNQITESFDLVDSAKYHGTIVLNFKDQLIEVSKKQEVLFKTDKTYLITGGTKGLGLEIAKWLVGKGVKNLALVSRSGLKEEKVKKQINELSSLGVNVKVYAADVADEVQMAQVFEQIDKELPSIVSIFHCAMILDDGFLLDMTEERFRKVLKPKVNGAMNLHNLSKNLQLDNFVLFSSISSIIGNVGQANYVVANALLDSFANLRKGMNLPATTINLGVLAESGVVARSENLEKILDDTGIRSFTNQQVLVGLEKILREKPTQIGFFDLNWQSLSQNLNGSGLFIFEDLINNKVGSNNNLSTEQNQYLEGLLSLESSDQHAFVVDYLKSELSRILKLPKDKVQIDKGIGFLGIDSILSVELLRAINNKFAIKMSSMELLSLPSVNQLSKMILEMVLKTNELELA